MHIKHIFFDLDHTLWDFETNSKSVFQQIFKEENIEISIVDFLEIYQPINVKYWKLYREDLVSKKTLRYNRLQETFNALCYSISENKIAVIIEKYIAYLVNYSVLITDAVAVLEYLKSKYTLHIITNGFEKVQHLKLEKSGIKHYFKTITCSEETGAKKPSKVIFAHALQKAKAQKKESVMVGDDYEADVLGAVSFGIKAIHFTTVLKEVNSNLTIDSLVQLKQYL